MAQPHYCGSARGVVEQLNLQLASSTVVVAGFVTFEAVPTGPSTMAMKSFRFRLKHISFMVLYTEYKKWRLKL